MTPSAQYYTLALVRLGSSRDIATIIKRVAGVNYDIRYWFQVEMGLAFEKRMKELGGTVPIELVRICQKRGFWDNTRDRRSRVPSKDRLNLKYSDNRSLYLRLVAHAVIGAAGQDDLKQLERLAQHKYKMVAKAAATRLAQLAGDEGIRILQAAVGPAIERRNAEPFGEAVRDAEIRRLGLAKLG